MKAGEAVEVKAREVTTLMSRLESHKTEQIYNTNVLDK